MENNFRNVYRNVFFEIYQSEENTKIKMKSVTRIYLWKQLFMNRKYRKNKIKRRKTNSFSGNSSTKMKTSFQFARMPLKFTRSIWIDILKIEKIFFSKCEIRTEKIKTAGYIEEFQNSWKRICSTCALNLSASSRWRPSSRSRRSTSWESSERVKSWLKEDYFQLEPNWNVFFAYKKNFRESEKLIKRRLLSTGN